MKGATISCDIVSSTALNTTDRKALQDKLNILLSRLTTDFSNIDFFGRLIKGDYLECAMKKPEYSLRIALIIKSFIKSMDLSANEDSNHKLKYFREHGARIAVAVGELTVLDADNDIIDGEAIYLSGRALQNKESFGKKKIIIKSTLFYLSNDNNNHEAFEAIFYLLDTLFSKHSSKQSEVIFHKLLGKNESEISALLKKGQSTINQHSTSAGWNAIEKAVIFFEKHVV